jgi:hypothetical protein
MEVDQPIATVRKFDDISFEENQRGRRKEE